MLHAGRTGANDIAEYTPGTYISTRSQGAYLPGHSEFRTVFPAVIYLGWRSNISFDRFMNDAMRRLAASTYVNYVWLGDCLERR
jgi:hypothetical protein